MSKKFLLISLSFLVLFLIDQLIKFWMIHNFKAQIKFSSGILFGLFGSSWWSLILTGLGIIFLCFLTFFSLNLSISFLGAGLILGGAVSNFIDRFIHGAVVDYISFFPYSAFNLADVGIFCGAAMIIYSMFRK